MSSDEEYEKNLLEENKQLFSKRDALTDEVEDLQKQIAQYISNNVAVSVGSGDGSFYTTSSDAYDMSNSLSGGCVRFSCGNGDVSIEEMMKRIEDLEKKNESVFSKIKRFFKRL